MVDLLKKIGSRLWADESGASLLEYSILIGLITAAVIATIVLVGGWVTQQWAALWAELEGEGAPPA